VVPQSPAESFDVFVKELGWELERKKNILFEKRVGGSITEGREIVGKISSFIRGRELEFEWNPIGWRKGGKFRLRIIFAKDHGGKLIALTTENFEAQFDNAKKEEQTAWFSTQVAGQIIASMGMAEFGDWITNRRARRPIGEAARETYRNPVYHRPNFMAILEVLGLSSVDCLIEIGCGGGASLNEALKSGCRAAAVDHSPEMMLLAKEVNSEAVTNGRLDVKLAQADSLPFPDTTFTCAVMTGVFGILIRPEAALSEISSVLKDDGRLVMFTSTKELRGTPTAPEPMASRLRFYEDHELVEMAKKSGFSAARVERPELARFARKAGEIPEEAIDLFSGRQGQLLIAQKQRDRQRPS
jgi:SAM-dependent methyltransferase